MPGDLFRRIFIWQKNCKYRNVILLISVVTIILWLFLLVNDTRHAATTITKIERTGVGEGSMEYSFRVLVDGVEQKEALSVKVGEKQVSEKLMKEFFDETLIELEKVIIGENESFEKVSRDLNLVTTLPGKPVRITWEHDRYDLMDVTGKLNEENLEKEPNGALITLKAYLSYMENESIGICQEYPVKVQYVETTEEDAFFRKVKREVEKAELDTKKSDWFLLPRQIGEKKIELKNPRNNRCWYVLFLGFVMSGLFVALQKQEEQQKKKEKEQQMMLDYPEITDKLALLLSAGITLKSAWQRIVLDYEKNKETYGRRYGYEEMVTAYHEMQSGVTEVESYENFGYRCGMKSYRKLATLLSQNLRKGTRGLADLLRAEAELAFEERKAFAKRKGEEAGTKLLGPMFCMLAMVLIIVIVPAFLSIQI